MNDLNTPETPDTSAENTGIPVSLPVLPEKAVYSVKDTLFAWLSLVLGYICCRVFFFSDRPPLFRLIFFFLLFLFAFLFFGKKKRKARSYFYPATALVLSLSLFFEASPALLVFVEIYVFLAFLLFCQTGGVRAIEEFASTYYFYEWVKALIRSPFDSFTSLFSAIGSSEKIKKRLKGLLWAIVGLCFAVIPTFIVLKLLSFDETFTSILDDVTDFLKTGFGNRLWSLLLGVPVGAYLFGAMRSSDVKNEKDVYDRAHCEESANGIKIAPTLVGCTALLPLLFLYGVYIFAQKDYFAAIFNGTLPDAYTFAEFARSGFFRLLAVSIINGAALAALRVFTKKNKNGKISLAVRIYTCVFSAVTIVLCFTALSQMTMYVSAYGLTRLRLYTMVFMVLLALVFLVLFLAQFVKKIPFAATSLVLAVLALGLVALPDTDLIIARHNYNCYTSGKNQTVDMQYFKDLGRSAVPVLVEMLDESNPTLMRNQAMYLIGKYAQDSYGCDLTSFSLPAIRAKNAYDGLSDEMKKQCAAAAEFQSFDPREPYEIREICSFESPEGEYRLLFIQRQKGGNYVNVALTLCTSDGKILNEGFEMLGNAGADASAGNIVSVDWSEKEVIVTLRPARGNDKTVCIPLTPYSELVPVSYPGMQE